MLQSLVLYGPLGVVIAAGVAFAMQSKHRLDILENEREAARGLSLGLEQKIHEIALQMHATEQEVRGFINALVARKTTGTPLSREEAAEAERVIAEHQERIEHLLGG